MFETAMRRFSATLRAYRYFSIGTNRHIRLLTLLPGMPQDTIRITLANVDLADYHGSSFPLYECLSYAWGDTTLRTPIYADNTEITVTRNLAEALEHLRHHEIPRVLWVDALCIDQGNMAERSLQVALMSEIYSGAQRVTIWLGPESEDSTLAMETLAELSDTIDLDLESQTFKPINDPGGWVRLHTQLPYSAAQVDALCNLFKRLWFTRLWVWQEARLGSSSTLILVGHKSMVWRRFYVADFFLRWKREFGLGERFFEIERRIETVNGMMNNITQSPMTSLALRTCWSDCAEPRDRIYALMGITTDEVDLQPDYSLSLKETYANLVLQHLRQLNSLELLSSCQMRDSANDIPSWVPDWRIPNTRKRFFDLVGAGEPSAHARFRRPDGLVVSGVHIDTIESVSALPTSMVPNEILDPLRNLAPPSQLEEPYISGGNTFDAFCRTFFANEFTERYKPAGELLNFQNYADARAVLLNERTDPESKAHFARDFRIQTAGRSVATTHKGYVTLVPDDAQSGDVLCHVLACRWPICLRPASATFQVLGFAYVDGDNDREVLLGPLPEAQKVVAFYNAATARWWPMYFDERSGAAVVEDPRLGPLPDGWRIAEHEEQALYNWYVQNGTSEDALRKVKTEMRYRSDPRLTVDGLRAIGVNIREYQLV